MSSADEDVQKLVNAIVGFAYKLLVEQGEFYPFAGAMKPDGEIVGVAGHNGDDLPSSTEVIELLKEGLREGASEGAYIATVIVYDVQLSVTDEDEMPDAVVAAIDHRDGYSQMVFFPYELHDGQMTQGTPFAQEGENVIFGMPS